MAGASHLGRDGNAAVGREERLATRAAIVARIERRGTSLDQALFEPSARGDEVRRIGRRLGVLPLANAALEDVMADAVNWRVRVLAEVDKPAAATLR